MKATFKPAAKQSSRRRRSTAKPAAATSGLVFVDVDGVLLNFEPLLLAQFVARGLATPTAEQMAERQHDFISEAFPDFIDREIEAVLVGEVFAGGALKTQESYPFLSRQQVAAALSSTRVMILTKLDPTYVSDRVACLQEVFGIDMEGRILTVWNGITKGECMQSHCLEVGASLSDSVLFDDRHDNLETALRLGAGGVLVEHSYNRAPYVALKQAYGNRVVSIPHHTLAEKIASLTEGESDAEDEAAARLRKPAA